MLGLSTMSIGLGEVRLSVNGVAGGGLVDGGAMGTAVMTLCGSTGVGSVIGVVEPGRQSQGGSHSSFGGDERRWTLRTMRLSLMIISISL